MGDMSKPGHIKILEGWMKSYKPEELFDTNGKLTPELAELAPRGARRMGANRHANGGLLLKPLQMPDFRDYAVEIPKPGTVQAEATRVMGHFLRDVMKLNLDSKNFRVMSPDENNSNRWNAILEVTDRTWVGDTLPEDDHLAPDGRVMESLASTPASAGWKATCSPAGTVSSRPTKRLCTSWTRCSTSTRSGSRRPARRSRGARPSLR